MAKPKINRIGKTLTMNCGLKATIIEYNRADDITVQFETGEIIQHKVYNDFKNGTIASSNYNHGQTIINKYAKKHIDETKIMNCGLKATIIEYNNSLDITIQFETGEIVQHKQYTGFKKGQIAPPNYHGQTNRNNHAKKHIGETRTMNCGLKATIIEYRGTNDIDIQFKTNEIVRHRYYHEFKSGAISPSDYNPSQQIINKHKNERIGETRVMNCGLKATIIKYRNSNDIDVMFENGTINQHRKYSSFKKKSIAPPDYNARQQIAIELKNERIGETNIMNCGLSATIIKYRKYSDIDIQFNNGIIVQHKQYHNFKQKKIIPAEIINDIFIKQFVTVKNDKWYYVCKHPEWNEPRILSIPEIYAYDISKDESLIK